MIILLGRCIAALIHALNWIRGAGQRIPDQQGNNSISYAQMLTVSPTLAVSSLGIPS